jgi:hypothetical protein
MAEVIDNARAAAATTVADDHGRNGPRRGLEDVQQEHEQALVHAWELCCKIVVRDRERGLERVNFATEKEAQEVLDGLPKQRTVEDSADNVYPPRA